MVDGLSGVITGLSEFAQGNEPTDFKNAHTIVCWGSNPAVSQPQNMHFICEAKENGTRYVVVDPVFNMNAAKADKFIPINATTDAALALGVLNEVISQGKEDQEFLRNHTEAPFLIKEDGKLLRMSDMGVASTQGAVDPTTGQPKVIDPYVVWDEATNSALPVEEADRPALTGVSEVNGVPVKTTWDNLKEIASEYTLSRTSEITGVSEEDIQELAAIYSQDEPVYTYMHYGLDHYSTGQYNFWAVEVLAWACGQVGKPGAACGRTVMNVVSKFNLAAQVPPNGSKTGRMVNSNRMKEILETGTYDGKPLTIKSLFVATHNMVSVNAEVEYIKDWLSEIEFVVVSELNMNDTARWADILLPAADWFEQDDIYAGAGNCPFVIYSEKATEPLFECKTDLEIFKLILDKMGYGDQFPWEDDESCIRDCLDSDALKALGITYETLKEKKAIRIVSGDTYISFEGGKFLTSSGRAMMYQETPFTTTVDQGEIDLSKERAPHWEPSFEADTNSEVRTKYPFHALSDHLRTRTHTQWWNVEYLKEIETEPVVKINPDDAAEIGIKEGDTVRMYNDRGSVVLKAVLNAGLPHGMVSYPRGFQKTEFIDGHAQSLPMRQFNQAFANYAYNDVAVAIEKM